MRIVSGIRNFFRPMMRTIWIALAGQAVFILSVITMSPLRMWENPVVNYNLFYVPILAVLFGVLFYRACVEEDKSKGYLYGFFSALVAWPLIGEVSSIPVEKGLITQFSDVEIKVLGGYYYVVVGWILLKILWRTKALKDSVCVFLMTFLCIWSFELYMDNYSMKVPIPLMPYIGNAVAAVFGIIGILLLRSARRTESVEKKTILGCLLYICFALVLMGSGQWQVPSKFYVKYESGHIAHEIEALQQEQKHLEDLRWYMIHKGLVKPEELAVKTHEQEENAAEEKH